MGKKGDETVEEEAEVNGASEGCSKGRLVPAMVLSKCRIDWDRYSQFDFWAVVM